MKATILSTTILLIFSMILNGQIIHVPADQLTIQGGIDAATNGDTILVEQGTYYENIKFNGKAITVASHYLINQDSAYIYNTIINGSQPGPTDSACVVLFNLGTDTTSVLTGFTITGGSGCFGIWIQTRAGGGIMAINCGAKITNNIVTENNVVNNKYARGGGISGGFLYANQMIIIEDNLVSNNSVTGNSDLRGGGICLHSCHARISRNVIRNNTVYSDSITIGYAELSGGFEYGTSTQYICNVTIEDNKIYENEIIAYTHGYYVYGGGMNIWCLGSNLNVNICNNTIRNNHAELVGGGIKGNGVCLYRVGSPGKFSGNRIFENTHECNGTYGGGLQITQGQLSISNNLIYNNSAYMGGGIHIGYSHAVLINNTIFGNDASYRGGGLCLEEESSVSVINSIVRLNTASLGPELWKDGTSSIYMVYTDILGGHPGFGNIDADPLFEDTTNFDFHLLSDSPCINSGNPAYPLNPDLSESDIGAYYFDHRPIIALNPTDISETTFTANWEEAEDAIGYLVDVAYDNEFTNFVEGYQNLDVGNTTSFLVKGLLSSEYYYRIRANYYFGRSGYSDTIPVILTSTNDMESISMHLHVYPNPIITETVINFSVVEQDLVTLSIIDITSREVELLLSKNLPTGTHKIEWNAKELVGGLYFLKLETNGVAETKKILVIK